MKTAVQVSIFGQQYTIRSDAPPEEVRRVAELVNGQVADVGATCRTADTLNLAVLALMNLGGTVLRLQGEPEGDATRRLRRLVARLEEALPDPQAGVDRP